MVVWRHLISQLDILTFSYMHTCGYRVCSQEATKSRWSRPEPRSQPGGEIVGRGRSVGQQKMCIDLATMPGTRQELYRARTTKKDDAYKFVILDATAPFINLKFNFKVVKSSSCNKTWSLVTILIRSPFPIPKSFCVLVFCERQWVESMALVLMLRQLVRSSLIVFPKSISKPMETE